MSTQATSRKGIAILGSTGSIGRSALGVVDLYPERLKVVSLAARGNARELCRQCQRYSPILVALEEEAAARQVRQQFPALTVLSGREGVSRAATHPQVECVVAAITGAAGLIPTHAALEAGKAVALANKETLVMAGDLIMGMVRARGIPLLPVDSEHSALHQCLAGSRREAVRRLVLTASGGPFLGWTAEALQGVRPRQALQHPTWEMGPKITVDSATLMNKGLEVIEAHHLFQMPASRIDVVIHPESVIHSLVEFVDGGLLAQMGITDMRSSLLYALAYPERWETELPRLELSRLTALHFQTPDREAFPCLGLAYRALEAGSSYPAALNAANEVAVAAFLAERLPFTRIPAVIDTVLEQHSAAALPDLEAILEVDREAREAAERVVASAEG